MPRWSLFAVVGCLYVALSVWIVAKQGQAYRDGLRDTRLAAGHAEKPTPPPVESQPVAPTAAVPETKTHQPEASAPGSVAHASQPTGRVAKKPQQTRTSAARGKAKTKSGTAANSVSAAASGKSAPHADPLANDQFWNRPELTRNWDLTNLSTADERRLGAELHDVVVELNPIAQSGSWLQRVEEVAKPLKATLLRKDISYTFTILDSGEVNAFSHPGGYVYVSRGLFDLIGEDEDYALQFAVGCEMAHVDLQHAIRCLQDPDVQKLNGGTIRKLYWLIIPFGYLISPEINQEFEADEWILSRMQSLGRTKRETLAFLYKLDGYATKHGFKDGKAKVEIRPDLSLLDIRYRRQIAAWKRLDHLKERIK
jgi:Peptidase family M48